MAFNSYPYPSLDWDFQGFDFAGIPNMTQQIANQMYADGVRFVGRYLYSSQYPNGKGISAQEAQWYLNAGIRIYFYYEVDSTDALQGYSRGVQNGTDCASIAQLLNVPQGIQIYCCCDTGVTDLEAAGVVMDYLQGFAEQLPDYNVGIYGGANVMDACYATFPDLFRCQAGAWGAQEFEPIDVRQWFLSDNARAESDGKIRIDNITIANNGYAYWRGNNVDLISAPNIENMWGDDSPTPPSPTPVHETKMPIWFYLRPF